MTKHTLRSGTLDAQRIEAGTGALYTPDGIPLPAGTVVSPTPQQTVVQTIEGKKGDTGKKGADGRTILNGPDDPRFLEDGVIGDFFLNTQTLRLFGPKSQEGWGDGVSLLGAPGPRGPTGGKILSAMNNPQPNDGDEGDFFINKFTMTFWGPKRANGWLDAEKKDIRGDKGDKGDKGDDGADGVDGVDGATILSGNIGLSAPGSSVGKDGDFYFSLDGLGFYGPKTNGQWPTDGVLLVGDKGDKGDKGDPGEIVGDLTSDRVTYRGQTLTGVLDDLLYVAPVISAFSSSITEAEKGASVPSVNLTWTLNKTPVSQSLNGSGLTTSTRSFTANGPFTVDRTFTLVMTDEKTSVNRSATLTFKSKRYWGVSSNQSLTDQDIRALTSELTTSRGKAITYDATGGRYVYYCYPASLGTVTATVGGLAFSDFTVTTRNFTNASGYTASYNIVRFNAIQTGASIQVVWA